MAEVKISREHIHKGVLYQANTKITVDSSTLAWMKKNLANHLTVVSEKSEVSTGKTVPPLPDTKG